MRSRGAALLAILTGAAIEIGVGALGGRREAWDSPLYWMAALPLAAIVSAAIGYATRGRDWLWAAAIVPGQFLAMMIKSGEIGSLWVLGVIVSAILSAPFIVISFLASRFRRRV